MISLQKISKDIALVESEYKKIQDSKVKDKHNKDGVYKSVKAKNLALKRIEVEL